ncbi:TPA: hypothetical protein ACI69N_000996 [Escherichia coli]
MNPSLLTHFTENNCPNWVCPSCHSTSLTIQEGTFHYAALPESVARWQEPEGEYEDILALLQIVGGDKLIIPFC